jgi:hypothetical protein
MTISLWVPGTVPPGMAERAIEAAWPGAHAITAPAAPPVPAQMTVTGGTLRLARPEILPLKTDHRADPLRALAAASPPTPPPQAARPAVPGCAAWPRQPACTPTAPGARPSTTLCRPGGMRIVRSGFGAPVLARRRVAGERI